MKKIIKEENRIKLNAEEVFGDCVSGYPKIFIRKLDRIEEKLGIDLIVTLKKNKLGSWIIILFDEQPIAYYKLVDAGAKFWQITKKMEANYGSAEVTTSDSEKN